LLDYSINGLNASPVSTAHRQFKDDVYEKLPRLGAGATSIPVADVEAT